MPLKPFAWKSSRAAFTRWFTAPRPRAASAVRRRWSYLHFTPITRGAATSEDYLADLTQVHALLGHPPAYPFLVVDVPIQCTSAFRAIEHLRKGVPETGRAVRSALLATQLFEFGEPHVRRIGAIGERLP